MDTGFNNEHKQAVRWPGPFVSHTIFDIMIRSVIGTRFLFGNSVRCYGKCVGGKYVSTEGGVRKHRFYRAMKPL